LWHFDEGSGTTTQDATGNYPGTLVNGPTWVAGETGRALNFNELSQGVQISGSPIDYTDSNFTVEAWVNWDGQPNLEQSLFAEGGEAGDFLHLAMSDGYIYFCVNLGGVVCPESLTPISVGQWHHVAAVMQSGVGGMLYVDGQL